MAITFEQCAHDYFDRFSAKRTNEYNSAQLLTSLRNYAFPFFGGIPVAAVDETWVQKALDPVWNEKPATANRIRRRIEAVRDFERSRKFRNEDNPAAWALLKHTYPLVNEVKKTEHFAALNYKEVPTFDDAGCRSVKHQDHSRSII